ncbi:MAG TPA: SDR family oxidoreductase [Kiritimatiellia bacterium]|nr:SDR family oxidoreductase [Kiritimatiellia bacterium]
MKRMLDGRVALVTGGAVRIGRAIALALAGQGCGVVVHYRSSAKEAAALCLELKLLGVSAWRVRANLAEPEACEHLIAEAREKAGRLDILVNNAAVFHKHRFDDMDAAALHGEFAANVFAPVLLTRAFARVVRRGAVVNLLDRRIAGNDPACIPYLLSKKALADFTRSAALALAPRITVNGVAPGPVLPPPGRGAAYLTDHAGRIPLGRPVKPEEVARAVVHLATSPSVTGQVMFVDGGQHLLGEGV